MDPLATLPRRAEPPAILPPLAASTLGAVALGLAAARESRTPRPRSRIRSRRRPPHFAPKAKRVIYLHMIGAPSQLDLFDDKPELVKRDGEDCPEELLAGKRFAFIGGEMKLAGSKFKFAPHGQSGQTILRAAAAPGPVADDIAVVRSLHTEEINHAPAQMFLHTGFGRGGRPSFGSWVTYGLGSENQDLPAYVVLLSGPAGGAGTSLWSQRVSAERLPGRPVPLERRPGAVPVAIPRATAPTDRRRVLDAVRRAEPDAARRRRRPGNRHAHQPVRDGVSACRRASRS